jgi:type III secretion protein T
MDITTLSDQALLLGLSSSRIAVAFLMLPLFTSELIPATLRNAIYIAFAILTLALQPSPSHAELMHLNWLVLFAKEAYIGAALGFFFGAFLWAFEAAGQIIDTKIGATSAQVMDPMSGQQTPLTGAFLGRLANFIFMFSGGFLLLIGTLLESYTLWPVLAAKPALLQGGAALFENELGALMRLTLMLAAPALVVLFAIDAILGLINRYAQQLNVYSLSMSIKTWASAAVLMLTLASLAQQLIATLQTRPGLALQTLRTLLGS